MWKGAHVGGRDLGRRRRGISNDKNAIVKPNTLYANCKKVKRDNKATVVSSQQVSYFTF